MTEDTWSPLAEKAVTQDAGALVWPEWHRSFRWRMGRRVEQFQPGPWAEDASPLDWGLHFSGFSTALHVDQGNDGLMWPQWDIGMTTETEVEESEDNGES